jgi:hypothetical protein
MEICFDNLGKKNDINASHIHLIFKFIVEFMSLTNLMLNLKFDCIDRDV